MSLTKPIEITQQVTQTLDAIGIPYFVGGSLASSLHGLPRATQDVDLIIDIKAEQILPLVEALQDEFYIDDNVIREAIQYESSFNIIHLKTMFKVDIFVLGQDYPSQQEMVRREQFPIPDSDDGQLYLASAEDVLLHKLYWYQMGGGVSERQWNDVLGIIQVQNEQLDLEYLRGMAAQREVSELLEEVLENAMS